MVRVRPQMREAAAASSKNISKKSPRRKSSRVSLGSVRRTSKYCCIIGVSFSGADDMGDDANGKRGGRHEKICGEVGEGLRRLTTYFHLWALIPEFPADDAEGRG